MKATELMIGDTKAFYGTKSLIHYLKQAIKDE